MYFKSKRHVSKGGISVIGKTPLIRYTDYDGNERDEEFYFNQTELKNVRIDLDLKRYISKQIEDAKLLAAQQAQINNIYANLANYSILSHNVYVATNYCDFYQKHIFPNQVNKIAYDLTRTGVASANDVRQFSVNQTGTKKSAKKHKKLSNQKPPEQLNKKKSAAIVEVAALIFLLLCLNGACFWLFIFEFFIH